jgi:hypothetical protein
VGEMIIYSVRIKIQIHVEDEWVLWMKNIHIPEVLAAGYFTEAKMFRDISSEPGNQVSAYEINYTADNIEKFIEYSEKAAPKLQQKHSLKFGGKYIAERILLLET